MRVHPDLILGGVRLSISTSEGTIVDIDLHTLYNLIKYESPRLNRHEILLGPFILALDYQKMESNIRCNSKRSRIMSHLRACWAAFVGVW